MKTLMILTLFLFVALPLSAFAIKSEPAKANTIDELAKMYDVSSCRQCHSKIYEEWENSLHAKSLIGSPRTISTLARAIKDGMMHEWVKSGINKVEDIKVKHMMTCLKCHLPQLKNATDALAVEIATAALDGASGKKEALEKLESVGINCLICHNMKAIVHKWVDGEPEKGVIYGNKEGPHGDKMFNILKKGHIMKESIMCGQCHCLGPNFEMEEPTQCATLYGSYLHAYVPSGGLKTCQECHMLGNKKGHLMPAYRDSDEARNAVRVDFDAMGYYFLKEADDSIPLAVVTLKMTNNAGHRIPDG
jgi:hypothetical protein